MTDLNISASAQYFIAVCRATLDKDPAVVLDLGSFNGAQAIELSTAWPTATVYAFECNPQSIRSTMNRTRDHPQITVVPLAVSNVTARCKFYPVTNGNTAASSLFRASGDYDYIERYEQSEVEVEAIRIDEWATTQGVTNVDVVWADLQGGELAALQGMGRLLDGVRVIQTEVEYKTMYSGQPLFPDVNDLLISRGFALQIKTSVARGHWGDAIYTR